VITFYQVRTPLGWRFVSNVRIPKFADHKCNCS